MKRWWALRDKAYPVHFSIFSVIFTLMQPVGKIIQNISCLKHIFLKTKWISYIDALQKASMELNISSSPILGFSHTSTQYHFTPRNSTLIPLLSAHISDGSADSSQEFCWCLIVCNLSYCTRDIS